MRTAATPFFVRAMGALRYKLSWPLQLAHTTLRLFGQNGLQNHAAATAFYFLLSATPLLLLLSYALQLLGHIAENSAPATILMAALYDQLRLDSLTHIGFIPRQAQLTVGGVGLLTLLLSSRGLVNAVQGAFSVIFPDPKKRNPVLSWVLPLIILPLLLLLMGLAVLAQLTLSFLAQNNFIGAYNAHALQVLDARDGVAIEAILSIKEPTRIRIEGAPITDVFGNIHSSSCGAGNAAATPAGIVTPVANPGGEIVLECDRDKGEIYIRPVGPSTDERAKPVNLFVSSAQATYTLVLRRSDTPADTIVIRDPTLRQGPPAASSSQGPLGPSANHVRSMKAMLVAMD